MALRIVRASEPIHVSQLVVTIFAPPGLGKTSLGFTASRPLLLDFDKGSYRAVGRQDVVQPTQWSDVEDISSVVDEYDTIVVDTVGRALDCLTQDIIQENYKFGRAGSLTLQGYGALKGRFSAWLSHLKSLGKDIVLIAHSDEAKKGDETVDRLDAQGASKNEVHKSSDAMGRLYIANDKRYISFSPSDSAFGKNPGQLTPIEIEDHKPDTLSQIIKSIKDKMNELTEEQKEAAAMYEKWSERAGKAKSADDFNVMLVELSDLDERYKENVKRIVWQASTGKVEYDRDAGRFNEKVVVKEKATKSKAKPKAEATA